jgi:hypothetical protein
MTTAINGVVWIGFQMPQKGRYPLPPEDVFLPLRGEAPVVLPRLFISGTL